MSIVQSRSLAKLGLEHPRSSVLGVLLLSAFLVPNILPLGLIS